MPILQEQKSVMYRMYGMPILQEQKSVKSHFRVISPHQARYSRAGDCARIPRWVALLENPTP